jgi:undecaprenyl diphosphate synthase
MHIAVIMDGNGRWAARRNLPRTAGHRAGAKAVDTIVEAAAQHGIDTLTLYAFSSDNWNRPGAEVSALFALLRRYLLNQTQRCLAHSIRLNVIGRRDRLQPGLREVIELSERATAHCSKMCLRIAIDYSAQRSLIEACRGTAPEAMIDRAQFVKRLAEVDHCVVPVREVDLLIRTGGEKRLSDFLLWECAYAELYFTDCLWPDFDQHAFDQALEEYQRRDRRFGGIGETSVVRSSHG